MGLVEWFRLSNDLSNLNTKFHVKNVTKLNLVQTHIMCQHQLFRAKHMFFRLAQPNGHSNLKVVLFSPYDMSRYSTPYPEKRDANIKMLRSKFINKHCFLDGSPTNRSIWQTTSTFKKVYKSSSTNLYMVSKQVDSNRTIIQYLQAVL